jgi:hypothetical protein
MKPACDTRVNLTKGITSISTTTRMRTSLYHPVAVITTVVNSATLFMSATTAITTPTYRFCFHRHHNHNYYHHHPHPPKQLAGKIPAPRMRWSLKGHWLGGILMVGGSSFQGGEGG